MSDLISVVVGALTLDRTRLARFYQGERTFQRGLAVLLAVGLIVGLVSATVDFVSGLTSTPASNEIGDVLHTLDYWSETVPYGVDTESLQPAIENLRAGLQIGQDVAGLPTRFPYPLVVALHSLGQWLSYPLAMLGKFLGYTIWVMLAARLLGGRGELSRFLGTAALSSAPFLLLVLERVPCLGPFVGVVAWAWALVILIVTTAVAHDWAQKVPEDSEPLLETETGWGKPILAVLLPGIGSLILGIVALASGLAALAAAIGAS
jgi:hypothetical protein